LVVLSGSVRDGDWAVAGERFGGGAGVCGAARPRRTFQFPGSGAVLGSWRHRGRDQVQGL